MLRLEPRNCHYKMLLGPADVRHRYGIDLVRLSSTRDRGISRFALKNLSILHSFGLIERVASG